MHWHFDTATRRLHVSNAQLDFHPVRALLASGWVPADISAIVYRTPEMTYVVCGFVLCQWIAGRDPSACISRAAISGRSGEGSLPRGREGGTIRVLPFQESKS
jgi:hypothetical protein